MLQGDDVSVHNTDDEHRQREGQPTWWGDTDQTPTSKTSQTHTHSRIYVCTSEYSTAKRRWPWLLNTLRLFGGAVVLRSNVYRGGRVGLTCHTNSRHLHGERD